MRRPAICAAALSLALASGLALQGCRTDSGQSPAPSPAQEEKAANPATAPSPSPSATEPSETPAEPVSTEQPDLMEVAKANRLSQLVGDSGPVHIVEEIYGQDGAPTGRSDVLYIQGSGGIVCSTTYTDIATGRTDSYFRADGKQYAELADGTLIMRAAVTPGAMQRYYDYYDKVESPFLYSKEEEVVSCVYANGRFEIETQLDLSSDRDMQRTSGLTDGTSRMDLKVDAASLQVIESESRLLSKEGETLRHSRLTVETGSGTAYIPEFMARFRNPSHTKTVTLVFDPGDEEERTAKFEIPAQARFETMDEDFYTAYTNEDGTLPYQSSSAQSQAKDLTLYLYRE